jgi:lipoyl(octanoyl) transferase
MMKMKKCIAVWCGHISYGNALDLQMQICGVKKNGWSTDVLLLLEHPPTITRGRNAKQDHLLVSEALLKSRGVELWDTDRGGDITFHGPGQLVGYPILSLGSGERDVHEYMRKLEDTLIRFLSGYGVEAKRDPGFTGVWTGLGKIAAMGVHISRWITRHGFALNVTTDLSYYNLIVPCGIVGKSVTSMQRHLSRAIGLEEAADRYVGEFATVFQRGMVVTSEGTLRNELRDFAERAGAVSEGQPPGVSAV